MRVLSVLLSVVLATPLLSHAANDPRDKEDAPAVHNIPFLENITIDGDAADWKDAGFRIDAFAPADGHVVPTADFDAAARVAWDKDGLLVLVSVVDDDVRAAVVEGRHLADDDSVELFLSVRAGATAHYLIAPPFPEGGPPRAWHAYLFGPMEPKSGTRLLAASRRTAAGYRIEARIPNDELNDWAKAGQDLRFNIVINDVDGTPPHRRRHAPIWLDPRPDAVPEPLLHLRPDKDASPPFAAAIAIAPIIGQGRARATVVADTAAAGRPVELRLGGQPPLKLDLARDDKPPRPPFPAPPAAPPRPRSPSSASAALPTAGAPPSPSPSRPSARTSAR